MFVTISRQYAAGGSEVARLVAQDLDWTVIDNAFIDEIATRSGYSPEEVASLEERVPTFLERLAQSTALSIPEYLASTPGVLEQRERLEQLRALELGIRIRVELVDWQLQGVDTPADLERVALIMARG